MFKVDKVYKVTMEAFEATWSEVSKSMVIIALFYVTV